MQSEKYVNRVVIQLTFVVSSADTYPSSGSDGIRDTESVATS